MKKHHFALIGVIAILLGGGIYFIQQNISEATTPFDELRITLRDQWNSQESLLQKKDTVTHLQVPENVRAFYISKYVAGTPRLFNPIIDFIDQSEINAVIIDIKDATGRVSFLVNNELVSSTNSPENIIGDIRGLIAQLHEKDIYVIGRISVFQDPYLTKIKPEWAVKKLSDGTVWKDYKGLSFLDPANREVWDYTIALARASYDVGFDEINFDYIRYPSDGNIRDIDYRLGDGKTRADNLKEFFAFLSDSLKTSHPTQYTSADLFGYTTTLDNDLGIGQIWENALPYFDYLAPMVYPSHYGKGTVGFENPAEHPYEIITYAMDGAVRKTEMAGFSKSKIRPWLQDFNMGATYDAQKIRDQIRATNDAGIGSWMMWDPSNSYTKEAYQKETSVIY